MNISVVIAGLVPAISAYAGTAHLIELAGTSPAMTSVFPTYNCTAFIAAAG